MNNLQKSRIKKLTAGVVITALAGFLYYLWVRFTSLAIPCLFYTATGLTCPGCGVTRMCLAILRFDFQAAFQFNPVLFISTPILFVVFAAMAFRYVKHGTRKLLSWQNICLWVVIITLLIQCVWRNMTALA